MKNKGSLVLIIVLFAFANFSSAQAAFVWPTQEWKIPFIGTMKTPDGFSAVEVKDFSSFIEQEKKDLADPKKQKKSPPVKPNQPEFIPTGTPTLLKDALPADEETASRRFLKSELGLYHLSMDDGEAIHMAWFIALRDGEKLPPTIDLFNQELDPAQTEQLAELKKWVDDNMEKAQYTDPKTKVSVKLLEMMPLQPLAMQSGSKLWRTGGRILITVDQMPFAFFSRIYAMNVDGHLVLGVLAGFDGERQFWEPVVGDLLLGLQTPNAEK